MRNVDKSATKFQALWDGAVKAARKILGITRGSLTDNAGRCVLFCTDADYRLTVMAATAQDESLTHKKCDNLLAKWGLVAPESIVGNPAISVYDEKTNRLVWVVGDKEAQSDDASAGMVTL